MKPDGHTRPLAPNAPALGSAGTKPLASAPAPASARRLASGQLFGDAVEIEIEHKAQVYRLRRTTLGKLILTK